MLESKCLYIGDISHFNRASFTFEHTVDGTSKQHHDETEGRPSLSFGSFLLLKSPR